MTVQQLETAKKLHDAIKDNERVLEHLARNTSNPDKINVLFEFLTKCGNLHASITKNDLGQMLFDHLVLKIEERLEVDRKALDLL